MSNTNLVGPEVLSDAVESERRRASVRSLDISFNELADMHKHKELHISPDYQRTFRWSNAKQSQFVESLVLEMPIPPIYAVEVREGLWELIDGLQRLSTYLHLRGELDIPDLDIRKDESKLVLEHCDIIPQLNGYTFDQMSTALQYRIRRSTLRMELVRQDRNPRFAYYMFKRLNTGGEPLSNQEARNCTIRILGTKFCDFLGMLARNTDFQHCIENTTDEFRRQMGHVELVLRYFAFKNDMDNYSHDIEPFLTEYMEKVTSQLVPFDYDLEEQLFNRCFAFLSSTIGERIGSRWTGQSFSGGFSVSHFEAFAIGSAQFVLDKNVSKASSISEYLEALENVKRNPEFKGLTTGGGKNFRRLYLQKIDMVKSALAAV